MGYLKYVRLLWKKPDSKVAQERHIIWRREPVTVRIKYPTRPDRARSLGFRAKQGIFMVRQRVLRGGHMRPRRSFKGRRPKRFRQRVDLDKSYQQICEERANRKFVNCEVLNSYKVGQDGKYFWYEVIMVDRSAPEIKKDKTLKWITKKKGRVFRGQTSVAKKSRGLTRKGKGAEKLRPSRSAVFRKKAKKQN